MLAHRMQSHLSSKSPVRATSRRLVASRTRNPMLPANTKSSQTPEAEIAGVLLAGTGHQDTAGTVVNSGALLQQDVPLLDELRQGDAELVLTTLNEFIKQPREEQDLDVPVYCVFNNRKNRLLTSASKKILKGCTSLAQLTDVLLTEVGPTQVDRQRIQVWWSPTPDFDNLKPESRGRVIRDANIPSHLRVAKA